jgi:hypothetical protein
MIQWHKEAMRGLLATSPTPSLRHHVDWRGERKEHPEICVDSGDSNEHMLKVAAAAYANEESQLHSDARNHFGSAARTQNPAQ